MRTQRGTDTKKINQSKKSSSIRYKAKRFKKMKKGRDNTAITQTRFGKIKAVKSPESKSKRKYTIVRLMDLGQFNLNTKNARKINQLDNSLVDIVKRHDVLKREFIRKLNNMLSLVVKKGIPLDHKQIVKSDIILPPSDISIDEASKLFFGEGLVHESIHESILH